jgi:hypothetical protein
MTKMKKPQRAALGPHLHRGVSFDEKAAKGKQYVITDEYVEGYIVRGRFAIAAEAQRRLKGMLPKPRSPKCHSF